MEKTKKIGFVEFILPFSEGPIHNYALFNKSRLGMGTIAIIIILWCALSASAQDAQFSQYNASPLYLNPGLAGSELGHRLALTYRSQWTTLTGNYSTYNFSYDAYLKNYNTGFGVNFLQDKSGNNNYSTTSLSGIVSYHLPLNTQWTMNCGFGWGIIQKNIKLNGGLYGDQILAGNNTPSADPLAQTDISQINPDVNLGVLLHNHTIWYGASVSHSNQPDQRILETNNARLQPKFQFTTGITLPLRDPQYYARDEAYPTFSPSFLFKQQGGFSQLDLGTSFDLVGIVVGGYYRGLPLLNKFNKVNQDAAIIVIGFTHDLFRLGYSYDIPLSNVAPVYGGSHELTAVYILNSLKYSMRRTHYQSLPCPKF